MHKFNEYIDSHQYNKLTTNTVNLSIGLNCLLCSTSTFQFHRQGLLSLCTERVPIYTKLTIRPIAFRIYVTCYRQKLTVWPGKSISCKKTPQNWLFWWTQIWITLLWKALDTKWLTRTQTRSTTLGGMTVQTSYVGGQWHQNWADTSPQHFFLSWHGNSRTVIFCW